ncbi:MAG: hypothetical protein P8009_08955 [Gammaproteobacteria bacterium]
MKRREFLKAGTAGIAGAAVATGGGLLAWAPRAEATTLTRTYYITEDFITEPDGQLVYFQGFSDSASSLNVPGKPIIVQEGDTVSLTIVNTLSSTHSFVIDGLVDSGPIGGGQTKSFSFTIPTGQGKAGSYMFYDGQNAPYNRLVGLHGGVAVMPYNAGNQLYAGSPTFVQQYFWIFNEIDPNWNDAIRVGNTPSTTFTPRYFTINGLTSRPPGDPNHDTDIDAMSNLDTALHGQIGDRTLVRMMNAGRAVHAVHAHGNHMEWLTYNGAVRDYVWHKDVLRVDGNMGRTDMIYPFEPPPDAYPAVTTGCYPMHLHDEMTQTAGGGYYMFGALTDIYFD